MSFVGVVGCVSICVVAPTMHGAYFVAAEKHVKVIVAAVVCNASYMSQMTKRMVVRLLLQTALKLCQQCQQRQYNRHNNPMPAVLILNDDGVVV